MDLSLHAFVRNMLAFMRELDWSQIISSAIEAFGMILAAWIGVKAAGKAINSYFHTYSDKEHNLVKLLNSAERDILIIVAVGDKMIGQYAYVLQECAKRNIKLRYLMMPFNKFKNMEVYIHHSQQVKDRQVWDKAYRDTVNTLTTIPNTELREFGTFMTVSYIGIDLLDENGKLNLKDSSTIQMMPYQYQTETRDSIQFRINYKRELQRFQTTAECMKQMWEDGKPKT